MKRRRQNSAACFAYFGAGLVACTVLPTRLVVLVLALALVVCGLSCGNR
ncbi:MAG: hypothetical protein IJ518_07095 [Clostridia bacterium]|nr:hypothetical protein [Clostridia bacterium]